MNFRYRLMQFLSGRYGVDKLTYGLLALGITLSVVNIFARLLILQLLVYAVMLITLLRILSRNHEARRRENAKFMKLLGFAKRKRDFINQRRADKCHIYKKCPACKAILRLPRKVGHHTTVCPRCGKEFKVKVRK